MIARLFTITLIVAFAGTALAQEPETTRPTRRSRRSTTPTTEMGVDTRLQPAPPPRRAEPGKVLATDAGGLGGATSYTQDMPLEVEGLIKWRQPFTNRLEFRGAWVTRNDWTVRRDGIFNAELTKARIRDIMTTAQNLNLNAVMFQMRGDSTVLYPSKLEPFSKLMNGKDPGFDPLKMAIEEAHSRGLEFHAYVNPVPCTDERTTTPAHPDHIFYKHCMPDSNPNWLVYSGGKPAPFNEYLWFNTNLPEVQKYIRDAMLDLVRRYEVDGIHYDRIRLPSPEVSDDPWSKARYEQANPDKLDYNAWQTDNITRMLTDIYGGIMELRPSVKVTAAVWGIYDHTKLPQGRDRAIGYSWTSTGLQDYHQDSIAWINRGCMDALVPMIYWNMGEVKPDYDECLMQFMTGIHNGRHVYGGQRVFGPEEMVRQVVATNLLGAHGTVPFTLGRLSTMADFYRKNVYPTRVATPVMPWKKSPLTGHVLVTVNDAAGKPVTDALVTLDGRDYLALSGTDGFCAILDVPPGKASLKASKGTAQATGTANVALSRTARVELKLSE